MKKRNYLAINTSGKDATLWGPSLSSVSCVYHDVQDEAAVVKSLEEEYRARLTPLVYVPNKVVNVDLELLWRSMSGMKFPSGRAGKYMIDFLVIDLGPSSLFPTVEDALDAVFNSDGCGIFWAAATGYKCSY